MLKQIRATLLDIAQSFHDTRTHHCQVEPTAPEGNRCVLTGTVLDAETRTAVTAALASRFPTITFDASAVQVLRGATPQFLTVSTTVTSLHAGPSFMDEMVSQLLNGWVVERLLEHKAWAYVRQTDGYLGWAYQPYLASAPAPAATHIVCEPISFLRSAPEPQAALVSRLVGGTEVKLTATEESWARLALAGGLNGWMPVSDLRTRTALPEDETARRRQIIEDAGRFIGVPHLWGGCTALGIDCSGLVRLLHQLVGVAIPRDADMQYEAGQPVEPPFKPGDLLFFSEGGQRCATHVGMSLGGWRIVHSSRSRNGVYEDDVQAAKWLRNIYVGARTFLDE